MLTSAEEVDSYPTVYSTAKASISVASEIGATAFANLLTDRTLRADRPVDIVVMLLAFGGLAGFLREFFPGCMPRRGIVLGVGGVGLAQFLFTAFAARAACGTGAGSTAGRAFCGSAFPVPGYPETGADRSRPARQAAGIQWRLPDHGREGLHDPGRALDPRRVTRLLDEYHEMLRRLVKLGEALSGVVEATARCVCGRSRAFWPARMLPRGWADAAPRTEKADRLNACLAAIEIRDAIDRFNARHPAAQQLPTRIGLDAGEIGLGPVGGELQAVGNPANAASRIEG